MKEVALIHATGYHFLQNYQGGVSAFLKDHPDFSYAGWIATESDSRRKLMDEYLTGMVLGVVAILKEYGKDSNLTQKMKNFVLHLGLVVSDKTGPKNHYKFQTINHNDLHMSNIMFR